jgi:glycosyltransferase involved in cell wall biosynthesis
MKCFLARSRSFPYLTAFDISGSDAVVLRNNSRGIGGHKLVLEVSYQSRAWKRTPGRNLVKNSQDIKVAVLLATYNGEQFVETQVRSLIENSTAFTLHWLDDHSTDNTCEAVRATAGQAGIKLQEWHQSQHQGVPGAFFQLLELVEADIYLFCDQDDIWEPGKIDATVAHLLPELDSPVLCFSDPLVFKDDKPGFRHRFSDVLCVRPEIALQDSRVFMSSPTGHTQGFTRPLRDIFVTHKEVARAYAAMHDTWIYLIAIAAGSVRFLPNVPTTLYRLHSDNVSNKFCRWVGKSSEGGIGSLNLTWRQLQMVRRVLARQAKGFVLASPTLPLKLKLERLLDNARLVSTLDRRQSLSALARVVRRRVMPPNRHVAVRIAAACLCSNATE